jgi:hypothetical protein
LDSKKGGVTMRDTIFMGNPGELWNGKYRILCLCPNFPAPFLSYTPQERVLKGKLWSRREPAISVADKPQSGCFFLNVDFTQGKELIKQDFENWLNAEFQYREMTQPETTRKKDNPPWHKLRQLSALRLHNAGLSYKKAQDFLRRNVKGNDFNQVLPKYANGVNGNKNEKVWHGAIHNVRLGIAAICW